MKCDTWGCPSDADVVETLTLSNRVARMTDIRAAWFTARSLRWSVYRCASCAEVPIGDAFMRRSLSVAWNARECVEV